MPSSSNLSPSSFVRLTVVSACSAGAYTVKRQRGVGPVLTTTADDQFHFFYRWRKSTLTVVLGTLRNDDKISSLNLFFFSCNNGLGGTGGENQMLVNMVNFFPYFSSNRDSHWKIQSD